MLISMLKYIKIFKGTPTCFDLNRSTSLNYSVTLTRYRTIPWRWSVKIETFRSTFKYFYVF